MRYLTGRYILQSLRKRRGKLFVAIAIVLVAFSALAIVQYWFVRHRVYNAIVGELESWGEEVNQEVAPAGKWNFEAIRRADISVPAWCILTSDGLLLDVEGFIPGIFNRILPPDDAIFTGPIDQKTAIGETWRLLGKKLQDGYVVLGVPGLDIGPDTNAKLQTAAAKFGSDVTEAAKTPSREIEGVVDYAVVGSAGELKAAEGGVPLRVDVSTLPKPTAGIARVSLAGKPYLLRLKPVPGPTDHGSIGTIITSKELTQTMNATRSLNRFDLWTIGLTAVFAIALAVSLISSELLTQTTGITLEQALKTGEAGNVEFKSTFQWDLKRNQYVEERRLDILKSIAGFLNAKGGTLFIGVSEDTNPPSLRGLEEDLKHVRGSKDKLQRTLRDLITTRIGPEFSPVITDTLQQENGVLYWAVAVQESPAPAFVRWKSAGEGREQKKFFVREGPKTSDLDNESTWHYIKNKWG